MNPAAQGLAWSTPGGTLVGATYTGTAAGGPYKVKVQSVEDPTKVPEVGRHSLKGYPDFRAIDPLGDLEKFINGDVPFDADPLVKMCLIHHQLESIHPFYDGNGRTGRILNVLYLVKEGLLEIPVLYLSSYIVRTKSEYYRLLQAVRDADAWEDWVMYMLDAVEQTAHQTIQTIHAIKDALQDYKHRIRAKHRFYSQDLINNLFTHPYTRIEYVERDLKVSRLTATRYLDLLAADGFLLKQKKGRGSYYINIALTSILMGRAGVTPR